MNTKIKKVVKEIDFTEQKIAEFEDKLKQLNAEKIELENLEIIAMFRGCKVSTYEIENVMKSFKKYHAGEANEPKLLPDVMQNTKYNMEESDD